MSRSCADLHSELVARGEPHCSLKQMRADRAARVTLTSTEAAGRLSAAVYAAEDWLTAASLAQDDFCTHNEPHQSATEQASSRDVAL